MTIERNAIETRQAGNYVLSIIKRENPRNYPLHPFAVVYERLTPKAKYSTRKVLSNYVFKTIEEAAQWVEKTYNNLTANMQSREAEKQKRREADAAVQAADFYKVGDIVVNTWGYEQTNVDFYEVVKVGNKTIEIKEIGAATVEGSMYSHGMACELTPEPGKFLVNGKSYRLKVKAGGALSSPEGYYYMHKWSGRPQYCSWYA
jgi:hypothetical protein